MRQEFFIGDHVIAKTIFSTERRGIVTQKEQREGTTLYWIQEDKHTTSAGPWYTAGQLRKVKFVDYLFAPTGFGKTPWPLFALLQLFLALGLVVSAVDGSMWIGWICVAVIDGALVFGSWMNYTRWWV